MGRAWSKETPTRFAQHTTTAVQFAHIESGVGETEHTTTEVQFANLERGVGETEPTTTEVQFANVQKGGEETDSEWTHIPEATDTGSLQEFMRKIASPGWLPFF